MIIHQLVFCINPKAEKPAKTKQKTAPYKPIMQQKLKTEI